MRLPGHLQVGLYWVIMEPIITHYRPSDNGPARLPGRSADGALRRNGALRRLRLRSRAPRFESLKRVQGTLTAPRSGLRRQRLTRRSASRSPFRQPDWPRAPRGQSLRSQHTAALEARSSTHTRRLEARSAAPADSSAADPADNPAATPAAEPAGRSIRSVPRICRGHQAPPR